jgi:phosphoesterase RecJ-like protein
MKYPEAQEIKKLIDAANTILVMQADNPDGDSLGSALALENILGGMGKEVILYCGVTTPEYLRYIDGWDRVEQDIPNTFDLSILVDVSVDSLFGNLNKSRNRSNLNNKPSIIIDHHDVATTIEYATITCIKPVVATAQVIYELAGQLDWKITKDSAAPLLAGILSDSLGLTNEGTSVRTIEIVAELVRTGITISDLDYKRRQLSKKSPELIHYKGRLLQRVEYFHDNKIAIVTIPWNEIEQYSHQYNPSVLVIDDIRQTSNTAVVVAIKSYPNNKITGKIRCNNGYGIANDLAAKFKGGGHPYASGFKIENSPKSVEEIKNEVIDYAYKLIDEIDNK